VYAAGGSSVKSITVQQLRERQGVPLIDVREPDEFAAGHIPNAINLPLSQMRDRYAELPTNREIWTCCGVGASEHISRPDS